MMNDCCRSLDLTAIYLTLGLAFGTLGATSAWALADLRPDRIHVADTKKTQAYLKDGLIIGGDKAVDEVIVRDVRRAASAGFERVVIDMEANRNGEPVALPRPPYYQVAVTPDEKRLMVTIWGQPKLVFDPKKVIAAFKKSPLIEKVALFPVVDDNTWTFVFELREGHAVEVFELANPVRIVMDVKTAAHK